MENRFYSGHNFYLWKNILIDSIFESVNSHIKTGQCSHSNLNQSGSVAKGIVRNSWLWINVGVVRLKSNYFPIGDAKMHRAVIRVLTAIFISWNSSSELYSGLFDLCIGHIWWIRFPGQFEATCVFTLWVTLLLSGSIQAKPSAVFTAVVIFFIISGRTGFYYGWSYILTGFTKILINHWW